MPATLDVSCPNCGKQLKVPAEFEGKRVKCKDCQEVFPVKAAARPAAKPAPPAAKAAPPPAAPPAAPKSRFADEEDEPGFVPVPIGVIHEEDVPRCPHCAVELDPPDAVVCLHCGFNNQTRTQAETKKVYAPDAADWALHLAPPIIALVLAIGAVVFDIICWVNMSTWLEGSFLEKDDKNPITGAKEFWIKPGAFTMFVIAVSLLVIIPGFRFGIRRLVYNFMPEEKVKK
jgi:hypothetical protein